jgi:signal transduction histidine kinase
MRHEGLFEQLNFIQDGITYAYTPGEPGRFDLPRLLGRPSGAGPWDEAAMRALIHPQDLARAFKHRETVLRSPDGVFASAVVRMRHADGRWRWIELREEVAERTASGAPRRIQGFASDGSELQRLADSLRLASKALLTAEAHERQRIARELHDTMAQHLVAIDLTLSRLERNAGGKLAPAVMADLRATVAAAHREVRAYSYLLHPPELERLGLEETLRKFVGGFAARTGLEARLEVEDDLPPIGSLAELMLFRVAQEALMNVHRHAGASRVDVALSLSPDGVVLEVGDDGVGLEASDLQLLMVEGSGGVGMAAMRARMRQVAGRLEILPSSKGLRVRAVAPALEDLSPVVHAAQ